MSKDRESVRPNDLYKMRRVPLGEGTFARVFHAEERATGRLVALKRTRGGRLAKGRIRHEIEAQKLLAPHPNIMPILDHDPGYQWYAMPIARGTLLTLRDQLDEEALASIMANLADALDLAHRQNMIHRDVSPNNILALEGRSDELRWVLADWGMVRWPYGTTNPRLTRTGAGAGTPGFDAPELFDNAKEATSAVDVYSLGRVAAWFLTGRMPAPGQTLLPDGEMLRWRSFVRACTEESPEHRLANMRELRHALAEVFTVHNEPPASRSKALLKALLTGKGNNLEEMISIALTYPDDTTIYIDHLARVPTSYIRPWVIDSPEIATKVAMCMTKHLLISPWADRDHQYASTPLALVFTILQALVDAGQLGFAQDVATQFFAADRHWAHPQQRSRTIEWLSNLQAPADDVLARVLARQQDLISYYQPELRPQSLILAAILSKSSDDR